MKHLKIVLTLTAVVVFFSGAVFLVENITTPLINAAKAEAANAAKAEVLPTLADYNEEVLSNFEEYDVADSGITDIFKIPGYGYVYQAQFQGYQSVIEYMIGINEDGEITGYKTLSQGDTPGLGAEIGNPDNWKQFTGMSIEDAAAGNIDGLSGATVTTNAWKKSLAAVLDFHNNKMLGFVYTDLTSSVNAPDGVTSVVVVSDGTNDLEVIYTAEFETNYSSSPNKYTVVISLTDGSIKKLTIDEATDSEGIGADIGAAEFAEQFKNMTQADVIAGSYDVQAGASFPITFSAFNETFEALYLFHREEFEGYVVPVETEAEKLARWHEELSSEGATFTDVSGDYDLTNTVITMVEEASDGTYIYTISFTGYNTEYPIVAMFGVNEDDEITGFRVIDQNDTNGLGGAIADEEYWTQFEAMNMLAAKYGIIDGLSGATVTTNGLKDAFNSAISFHEAEILGTGSVVGPETDAQKLARLIFEIYPTGFTYSDITANYTLGYDVEKAFEVFDASGASLGYALYVSASGAGYTGVDSNVTFVLGIHADRTMAGFRLFSDGETPGRADSYYEAAYGDAFNGIDIETTPYDVDETADATDTHEAILDAIEQATLFFRYEIDGEVFVKPDPIPAADATLQKGISTADSFVSIYDTTPFNANVRNIYEAYNGANQVGYVYVGEAQGNGGTIYYIWGIDMTGTTVDFEVVMDGETWAGAGVTFEEFRTSTWLTYYEGIDLETILSTPYDLDAYAGVTNTTSGMVESIESIAQYHIDHIEGGAE